MKFYSKEKYNFSVPNDLGTKITVKEVERFITDCIIAAGCSPAHATQVANVLVAADMRGHFSHGLNRLEMYVNDIEKKICNGCSAPTIIKQSVSTALVDGKNALGPVVGNFCMNLAIEKAKETGIAWVAAKKSNHYGISGFYTTIASNQGLIGMSFSNAFPVVAPTRAKEKCFGTNPMSVAAPAGQSDSFLLDMSTSVVALGKIEVQEKKSLSIPEGWAVNKDGNSTTDPSEALNGALMPLGGKEITSGYKGYGLSMMVEVLTGILSGSKYGPHIKQWHETTEADLGQTFVAIDPTFFSFGFEDRMSDIMNHCRNMEPMDPSKPVLVPGDPEKLHEQKVLEEGGISYHISQIKDSYRLGIYLGVHPMKSTDKNLI